MIDNTRAPQLRRIRLLESALDRLVKHLTAEQASAMSRFQPGAVGDLDLTACCIPFALQTIGDSNTHI